MVSTAKRNPELNRLYLAVGLGVLIWTIFRVYRLLSAQVDAGVDGTSRWALLALGLANALAIGTLAFIVARSLAKLYFERRSGILGARIRTRLVVALFGVGILPSLLLFLMGRNFISKNVDRWFRPDTQQVILDGKLVADAYREQLRARPGAVVPKEIAEGLVRCDNRAREFSQVHAHRDTIESLPQSTFLFLTLLTLFAAVWTGLAISRTISEPVRSLAKAAQRVGTGDLEVALPEHGEDELAFLCRSFNAMIRDLRLNRQAIETQAERIGAQREYLTQLLEALPVGVMSWQKDLELRTFNPACRRWFGLEDWDRRERAWQDLMGEPRLGGLPALVSRVRLDRQPGQEEFRIGGEGEGRLIRAMVLPLTDGGVLAVLEDLTLLAQAEKRAAWQEVARRMAHEVKNPLTPIKLTTQRLLRRSREGRLDPQAVADGAQTILEEVASLARLVDSFSRFAKLPVPHPERVDAGDLVRQVLALYAPVHGDILWETDLPPGAVEAFWDGDMVKRALINLVDNSVAAMDGRGRLRLALAESGDRLRLDVEDDGCGIPEGDRAHLFEPSFSTKGRGTGLGLAIVRSIAQDHGGDVTFEPLAPGSRFCLLLPRRAIV
jgi:two-component system, NtrC family, nitrogen regulation sensor histidine kinase NtrY